MGAPLRHHKRFSVPASPISRASESASLLQRRRSRAILRTVRADFMTAISASRARRSLNHSVPRSAQSRLFRRC